MLIDPRHLEQLAVIMDAGTLSEAARLLNTSQPALSRMISTLEHRIGMKLFERTTRPLKLTLLGQELSDQGRAIRVARVRAEEFVDLGFRGFFGVLKIGAPPFLCERLVSEAVSSFITHRPEIRIELVPDYYARLQERIVQNQIDIIIGPPKFIDDATTELALEPLIRDKLVIVGRRGHPVLNKQNAGVEDLEDAKWIGHSDRSVLRSDMVTALRLLGIKNLRFAFQSESAGAVIELLKNTDFLTVLPSYALKENGQDGLGILDVDLYNPEHSICMITLAKREETKLMTDFKNHMRDHVSRR